MRRLVLLWTVGTFAFVSACGSAWAFSGLDSRSTSSLDSLALPGFEQLTGAQQALIAERVRRTDPVAIATRSASRHAFSGLDTASAARLARQTFPEALAVSSSTTASMLAPGQRITRYLSDHAASLDLGHGKHGVLESSVPIATRTASGREVPIDLRLRRSGGGFEPSRTASGVLLHAHADAGMTLTDTGLSIAPAQGAGSPGVLDGGGVLYANTQTDADTLLKPVAQGVAVDAVLRSARSPQRLSFAVSGPGRVRLAQRRSGVAISLDGDVVANVLPPLAQDATGTPVPVTMSVAGNRLVLHVVHRSGDFQYPIDVDPVVEDKQIIYGGWNSVTNNSSAFGLVMRTEVATLTDEGWGTYSVGQFGAWAYETKGVSKIEAIGVEATSVDPGNDIENRLLIAANTKVVEGQEIEPANFGLGFRVVHVAGSANNAAEFGQWATKTGSSFTTTMYNASVRIVQETPPTVEADTTDVTIESRVNVAHTGGWLGGISSGNLYAVKANDVGIGVTEIKARSPQVPGVEHYVGFNCFEVQCPAELKGGLWGTWYPDGEDTVEVTGSNATHGDTTTSLKIKVDNSAPHDLALAGLPANAEINDSVYKLTASASDGAGTTPSSGLSPLAITVDGIPFGTPQGGCSVGPCSTTGEWTISGSQFAVGQHQLVLTATDKAGNKATKEMAIFVTRPVTPLETGPGSVNPESGELTLRSTDVSVATAGGQLIVGRGFGSEHLTDGVEGPLGPNWKLDLGGSAQSIVKLPTGSVLLDSGDGLKSLFTPGVGGEYTAPKGDSNLKLVESTVEGKAQFQLSTAGATTTFKLPAGGTGNTWVPVSESQPNNTNVTTFSYQVAGSAIEPTEVLAPVPANVTCTGTLVRGCRALNFVYATSTTATGENESQWGDYNGRLKQVTFTAWDPSTSAMSTTVVAQYSYDGSGRLRAEWDPRVSPAVKTTYGYDVEGRVTALVPGGEQPWLFTYGTSAGDIRTGHLLKTTRPATTTAAGTGIAPQNTALPALSTNAPEGKTMTVTTGTWTNTPLAYGYQWEECQTIAEAESCSPITGATNSSYRVEYHGANRWLKVLLTADNSNGAMTVASNSTGVILPNTYMEKTAEFASKGSGNGQLNGPSGIATDSSGNIWVADTGNNRVEKFSSAGAFLAAYGTLGSGNLQFKGPSGIAVDQITGTVWVADTGNSRIEALTSAGSLAGLSSTGTGTSPTSVAITKAGTLETLVVGVGSQIATFFGPPNVMTPGTVYGGAGTGNGQFTGVGGLAVDEGASKLYATDAGGHRVEVFSTTSGLPPVLTYQSQFGSAGTGEGHLGGPQGLALQSGNLFVADKTNSNVQKFSGSSSLQLFTEAAGVYGVATYPTASNGSMYVLNQTTSKIAKWVTGTRPAFLPSPPTPGTSAVTTMEYGVPVSGTGAPYAMSSTEVAKWGQTDAPVEAMAIAPPDSPQGWPASSYARATVYYLDSDGRTVNRAIPSKGISTTEYNSKNDVVRTLSALNRAKALQESNPLEVSQLTDSQSTYSEDGSEVLSTMGPQHTVKLANGTQVLARHKTRYFYDEGAPGTGGPYHLVTKLTEGALLTGGTEEDVHTTVNSYSGQEGLGWKLHQPTSITTDPTGLKMVRTKLYDATTGAVTDAIMPAGNQAGGDSHDTQTIYYTALANAKVAACGLHPEWANLPCQSKLAKAPETAGIPNPPVTTTTYNLWDQSNEVTSVVGADSRKAVRTYDGAGRVKTEAVTSTTGTSRPTVTFGYDSASGRLVTSSTTEGSTTRTLTSVFDKWGELSEYTDADGVTSKYTYDIDGRTATTNDGKGTATYTYGATSTTIADSALTFIAEYDVEGNVRAQYFGNGVVEKYIFDANGQLTGVEYVDTSSCSSNCTWYSDSVVPSITEKWMTQSSTLSSQAYKYDAAGRLTQVQDTPAGLGCTTRLYGYDADANRTSETSRVPGAGGVCASEGGTTVSHSYDPANRVKDTGAAYDAFGDTTSLPAGDAGGTVLTGSYYVNGRTASQTQNGQTNGFYLDPSARTREMVATGTKTLTSVLHYGNAEGSPSWTAEGPTGWTRDVADATGALVATQTNGEAPIMQITNLHGDVVATASLSASATGLSSSNDTTEYGVPRTGSPPKYSWLGGAQRATTLASGVVAMGARSYVPQLGRFLQTDPQAGGSANAYAYASADPVNTSDASGEWTNGVSSWLYELNVAIGQEIVAREAAREAAARRAAEEAARQSAEAAAAEPGEYESPADTEDPFIGVRWKGTGLLSHGLGNVGKDMGSYLKKKVKQVFHKAVSTVTRYLDPVEWYKANFENASDREVYCTMNSIALLIVVPEATPIIQTGFIGTGWICAKIKVPGAP